MKWVILFLLAILAFSEIRVKDSPLRGVKASSSDCYVPGVELCSFADEDEICVEALQCQIFPLGVCTRHNDCEETGICYAVVAVTQDHSTVTVTNFVEDLSNPGKDCLQEPAIIVELNMGECNRVIIPGGFVYRARVTPANITTSAAGGKEGLTQTIVMMIVASSFIFIVSLLS